VVGKGAGASVQAGSEQALAEANDDGLGFGADLLGAGSRPSGAGLESLVATLAEAGD
jgi:hypothetical protein